MKSLKTLFVILLLSISFIGFRIPSDIKKSKTVTEPFTLVEFFTSQSCKNSPPAEDFFNALSEQNNPNLFLVAYHIDYWNKLDWEDTFSKPEFSQRQYEYSSFYELKDHYTPQMVVNGETEFAGNHEKKLENALLQKATIENEVAFTASNDNDVLSLSYTVTGRTNNKSIHFLVIQKKAAVTVLKGDNKNKKLLHSNVALKYKEIRLKENTGNTSFKTPKNLGDKDYYVMAFVQDSETKKVTGIARLE